MSQTVAAVAMAGGLAAVVLLVILRLSEVSSRVWILTALAAIGLCAGLMAWSLLVAGRGGVPSLEMGSPVEGTAGSARAYGFVVVAAALAACVSGLVTLRTGRGGRVAAVASIAALSFMIGAAAWFHGFAYVSA